MMRHTGLRVSACVMMAAGCLVRVPEISAQTTAATAQGKAASSQDTALLDQVIRERWPAILGDVAQQNNVPIEQGRLAPVVKPEVRRRSYRDALVTLLDDSRVRSASREESAMKLTTQREERRFLDTLEADGLEHAQVKSVNATSANPAAGSVAEHSGFSELIALALNGKTFFNADATAVSLNLSALVLVCLGNSKVYAQLPEYQQKSFWRRIGGTVVFGAKIPEKEITGLSGLPNADELLDVFTWDVKVRVLGDKDPAAGRWYKEAYADGALIRAGDVLAEDYPDDARIIRDELVAVASARLAQLKAEINQSAQLTLKTSGTHLTKEPGKNKYAFGLLYDQGFGVSTNITADFLYSITNEVSTGTGTPTFEVRQLTLNASAMIRLLPEAIVKGRPVNWSNGGGFTWFTNRSALPTDQKNTWKLFSKLEIPITEAASIPLSVVYTNDDSALKKQKYVSGFVGVSYDFWATPKALRR